MKTLLILLTLASSIKLAKARESKLDTLAYLNTIVANKALFVGKPFSELADSLKIKIKFFSPFASFHYNTSWETYTSFSFYFPQDEHEMYLTYPELRDSLNLDKILAELNNKSLFISPVLYYNWGHKLKNVDKDSVRLKRRLFEVSSLEQDIYDIADRYTKRTVAVKLYGLLSDTTRDFYANALLYDLIDNRKLAKLMFKSRDQWVESGQKKDDLNYWGKLFELYY